MPSTAVSWRQHSSNPRTACYIAYAKIQKPCATSVARAYFWGEVAGRWLVLLHQVTTPRQFCFGLTKSD